MQRLGAGHSLVTVVAGSALSATDTTTCVINWDIVYQ